MRIDRGDLTRALEGKTRYLAVEHVMRFGARLAQFSPETAQRIAVALVRPLDCIVFPRVQLTAAEQARRYKQMLDLMSQAAGVDLARKALEMP
jgi:acyl-CoA synthetase (NDP forming)